MKGFVAVLLVWLAGGYAFAHEVRPGYLELRQTQAFTFEARLRQPVVTLEDGRLGGLNLAVEFPPACHEAAPPRYERVNDYLTATTLVTCPEGLGTSPITIAGLQKTITDVYVSFHPLEGGQRNGLLTARDPAFFPFRESSGMAATQYLSVGVRHLLGGLDHVLFLVGLFLLVPGGRQLFLVGTAFAAAHSTTLAFSALGWLRLSPPAVEAAIALSVLILAFDAARRTPEGDWISLKNPHLLALGFGLLHGLGFASVLAGAELTRDQLIPALFFFNIGVEIGQVAVFLALLVLAFSMRQLGPGWDRGLRQAASFGLGAGAVYFMWTALAALVG